MKNQDEAWLLKQLDKPPTENDLECFCERTAIMVEDGGLHEDYARTFALDCLGINTNSKPD